MKQYKDADSKPQRDIENHLWSQIQEKLGTADLIEHCHLHFPDCPEIQIEPDFYSKSAGIIGEIHAHIGRLKPAQQHKIAADILKMVLFERATERTLRKIIVVCSEDEYEQLRGKSHLAYAIHSFGIEVLFLPLDAEKKQALSAAMKKQDYYTGHSES